MWSINSGEGAVYVLINCLLAKAFMSFYWRIPIVFAGSNKEKRRQVVEGAFFKNSHAAQLNDAEWAPLFVATLLFLHLKGVEARGASMLAVFGCVEYVWAKILLPFPSHTLGAVARYISLIMICSELLKILA